LVAREPVFVGTAAVVAAGAQPPPIVFPSLADLREERLARA
jgi:hypothetical protein